MGLIAGRSGDAGAGPGGQDAEICSMIMPYGKKATQAEPSVVVAEMDFNALGIARVRQRSRRSATSPSAPTKTPNP